MEMQINTFIISKKNAYPITLFGYATKSLPGLEIHGLGKHGKSLKEKIIFLTRSRQLPVPLKRFVLACDELNSEELEFVKWLEFPLLLLYWHLSQIIPTSRLDNCLVSGQIHPAGLITLKCDDELKKIALNKNWIILTNENVNQESISPKELLQHIPELKWIELPQDLRIPPSQYRFSSNNL